MNHKALESFIEKIDGEEDSFSTKVGNLVQELEENSFLKNKLLF